MSNPKGKALPNLISMYLIMLVIYCLDVFFLKSDLTVLGDNFYSRFLCLTVLLMTVVFKREHLITFGIRRKATKLKSAFIFGTFFSVVPIATVSIFEFIFFKILYPNAIDINFTPPSLSYVQTEGYLTPALCIAIYILTSLFAPASRRCFFADFCSTSLRSLRPLR